MRGETPTVKLLLTEREVFVITNALRVAAERYNDDAKTMVNGGQARLAEQFVGQVQEANTLRDKLESL
jgi:hypothetical protein